MPKMKTKRIAKKKFIINAKGKIKHAQAGTSHNTAKKSPKRRRQLRGLKWVDSTNMTAMHRIMPYYAKG